jgi:hypothetical protein
MARFSDTYLAVIQRSSCFFFRDGEQEVTFIIIFTVITSYFMSNRIVLPEEKTISLGRPVFFQGANVRNLLFCNVA